MNNLQNTCKNAGSSGERGSASLKFIIFILVLAAAAYVAYLYVPIAYQASLFKVYMQDTVDKAVATGQTTAWVENQFRASAPEYGVPPNATYKVEQRDGRMQASARWMRPVVLPVYTYQYNFDHTVKSGSFLTPR
jgi:hypothetical protein